MHYYISCYFYDKTENPLRKKLKDEFQERYPWIAILERSNVVGFHDYKMINDFMKKIDMRTCESITVIDSDLILPDNFRTIVQENIEKYDVLHNCGELVEIKPIGNKEYVEMYSIKAMSLLTEGFSGACWSYSGRFLRSIESFPENFLYGGFDFIQCIMFNRQYSKKYIIDHYFKGHDIIGDFYEKASAFFGSFKNSNMKLYHVYHGPRKNRILRLEDYKNLTPELLKYLMYIRESQNED